MKVSTFLLILPIIILSLTLPSLSQAQTDNTLSTSSTSAVCVWPVSGLRDAPGKSAGYIESINYGHRVQVLGEMKYAPEEDRVYMKVMSQAGNTGWVHKYLYEDGADMVVVKQPSRIYEKPNEMGTLTNEQFEPGELVAMTSFQDGWIQLTSMKRDQKGWVQSTAEAEAISIEESDISLAMQMIKAEQQTSDFAEIQSLKALRGQPGFASSAVRPAVERRINGIEVDLNQRTASKAPATKSVSRSSQPSQGSKTTDSELQRLVELNGPLPGTNAAVGNTNVETATVSNFRTKSINSNPNYNEELVLDETTGQEYIKVTERGSVYEVKTVENVSSVYYAYHKTLPKGTRILLSVPGNPGFVELEITNKLAQNREQIIALPREVINAVWGVGANSKGVEAAIVYFVKK